MVKLTIDHEIRAKLGDLNDYVELCDDTGRTLGYFQPVADRSMYDAFDSTISEEELDRREKAGGGRPLADILADLKKMP